MNEIYRPTNVEGYLNGYLLTAMPCIMGSRFEHSIVFICGHDAKGAIGLIMNKPLPSIYLPELLKQLEISKIKINPKTPLYFGGHLDMNRGFVLHSLDYTTNNTVVINMDYGVTATLDILRAIAAGKGPKKYRISLGYTGWEKNQLEQEIQDNHWLVNQTSPELIFNTRSDKQWHKSLDLLGASHNGFVPLHGGHA